MYIKNVIRMKTLFLLKIEKKKMVIIKNYFSSYILKLNTSIIYLCSNVFITSS